MAGKAIFIAWVSKYALTEGVYAARVQDCGDGMVNLLRPDGSSGWGYLHGEGKEWHRTREGAEERAEVLRGNKIKSLKKQIARLEGLSFSSPNQQAPHGT
jgi:hypothetical protein